MNKKLLTKSTVVALVGLFAAPAMAELSISGWINQEVSYLDNGDSSTIISNAGNGNTLGSRITFAGSSDLPGGYTAGFDATFEMLNKPVGYLGAGSACDIKGCDNANGDLFNVLGHSLNFAGGFGKITMGLQSMPTDNIAVLEDPSLTLWSSISPVFANNAATLTGGGLAGSQAGDFLGCYTALPGVLNIGLDCNGIYRQGVRYDLPTFVDGLGIAVGWANNDIYDVAGKYKTAFGRVNTQIALGYAENHSLGSDAKAQNFQMQAGFMDNAGTGLFGSIAYQMEDSDITGAPSTDAWWMKAGIKRAFNSLGDTAISGQFGMYNDQYFAIANLVDGGDFTESEVQRYGVELVQYFGSAFQAYVVWESLDVEATSATLGQLDADRVQNVRIGGVVFF